MGVTWGDEWQQQDLLKSRNLLSTLFSQMLTCRLCILQVPNYISVNALLSAVSQGSFTLHPSLRSQITSQFLETVKTYYQVHSPL